MENLEIQPCGEGTNIGYWEKVLEAPTPAYHELFQAEKQYIRENISHDAFVLDIGCGEGRNMQSILENTPNVCGIDMDPKAVEDTKKRFAGIDTVQVVYASATELPFTDETFDAVTFLMILPNLEENKVPGIKESARVLKKDGKLILSTFAETAFDERMKVYKQVGVPINRIEGATFYFEGNITSEQSSLEQLTELGAQAGLELTDHIKVGDIAYICTFKKKFY
ncbi:MAG: class I SAM-dependent methyltransferase [Patescibacteria group bacterium]